MNLTLKENESVDLTVFELGSLSRILCLTQDKECSILFIYSGSIMDSTHNSSKE